MFTIYKEHLLNKIKLYIIQNILGINYNPYLNKLYLICIYYSFFYKEPLSIPKTPSLGSYILNYTKENKIFLSIIFLALIRFIPINQCNWIKEIIAIVIILIGYSLVQKKKQNVKKAFDNAMYVIDKEKKIGIYNELPFQKLFLSNKSFIKIMNFYYGATHIIITLAILILLYTKQTNNFKLWRYTFIIMNCIASIIYYLFPLMPPRLLDAPCPKDGGFGGACYIDSKQDKYDFVDTIKLYGGPMNFNKGIVKDVSNQYAAMPSMHVGYAIWCAYALYQFIHNPWIRVSLLIYPIITILNIIITANHFWLDAIVGILVFIISLIFAYLFIK